MNELYDKYAGKSPEERKLQTDISLDVERYVRIIPPLLMKEAFERPARREFKRRCEQHRSDEKYENVVLNRIQNTHHDKHAEPVYRADRTCKEPAVHEFAVAQCGKNHLAAPSDKRIHYEYPCNTVKIVRHIYLPAKVSYPLKRNHAEMLEKYLYPHKDEDHTAGDLGTFFIP